MSIPKAIEASSAPVLFISAILLRRDERAALPPCTTDASYPPAAGCARLDALGTFQARQDRLG